MKEYVARLCWNSESWIRPTGESSQVEKGTYAARVGYGHEEWLCNLQWVLDGWKYGFLQPVNRSYGKMAGQVIDVRLYTISPGRAWYYVGRIHRCEVLTEQQAEAARKEIRRRGWLRDMEQQAKSIGGGLEGLRETKAVHIFNVRFRPHELHLEDPMIPVGDNDAIRNLTRYTLVELDQQRRAIRDEWPTRAASDKPRPTDKQRPRAGRATEADLVHNQLQNELCQVLKKQFGTAQVTMEEGFADLKLRHNAKVHLFEIKADPRPRAAIRQALGQLLEYAFAHRRGSEEIGLLVVAAPGELGDRDRRYLEHLRATHALPVHYLCLRRGIERVELPL